MRETAKIIILGGFLFGMALVMPARAVAESASPASSASMNALREEVTGLREQNALLRERDRLRRENAALYARIGGAPPPRLGQSPDRASAETAYAADMPVKAVYKAPSMPSWTGFYLGAGLGSRWTETDAQVTSTSNANL